MGVIAKEDKLRVIGELVNQTALRISGEEMHAFEKANPDAIISNDDRGLVTQRAVSELMFRTCNLKCPDNIEEEDFKASFDEWFATSEEEKLRNMCRSNMAEFAKKNEPSEDENISFSERCHRLIKAEWSNIGQPKQ